jgi:DNA-binding MarR family transcriptional regulator
MAKVRKAEDRVRELKGLLTELGRMRSLREPMADLSQSLTPPQIHTLMWLKEDGALALSTIAARVGCAAPTITGVIDRLERSKLVARVRDTADRRVILVKLTAAGERMARKIDEAFSVKLLELFFALGADDGDALLSILARMADKLRGRVPEGVGSKRARSA